MQPSSSAIISKCFSQYTHVLEETNLPKMNAAEMLIFFFSFDFKRNVVGFCRIEHFV